MEHTLLRYLLTYDVLDISQLCNGFAIAEAENYDATYRTSIFHGLALILLQEMANWKTIFRLVY